jgi:hypothetical protein
MYADGQMVGQAYQVKFFNKNQAYSNGDPDWSSDTFFFVSGAIGRKGVGSSYSVSVFGGDMVVSGALEVGSTPSGVGGGEGIVTAKSTTNGTVNQDSNNDSGASTGDMNVRAGTSVATINTTNLTDGSAAYWTVSSSKILATDVIVATCNRAWCPVTVYGVVAGSFIVGVTNNTGGTLTQPSTTLTLNWVAL